MLTPLSKYRTTLVEFFLHKISSSQLGESMLCHRGFLGIARRMEAMVIEAIGKDTQSSSEPMKDLIFTGHSAGAEVAQILFGFACCSTKTTALSQAVAGGCIIHFLLCTRPSRCD